MKTLKIVAIDLSIPSLDINGNVIGKHGLPCHLLTPTGKTNDGCGIAYVISGLDDAEGIVSACDLAVHHELVKAQRDALLAACKLGHQSLRTFTDSVPDGEKQWTQFDADVLKELEQAITACEKGGAQ